MLNKADPPMAGLEEVSAMTEADIRQWWQTLMLALQRQSVPRLDTLGISASEVRADVEQMMSERSQWERWELFIEAVARVGEDAFVELVRGPFE